VLGSIRETVTRCVSEAHRPIGFIVCDVDVYLAAMNVFRMFCEAGRCLLRRLSIYLDDINSERCAA
jgi:hypothetical protein